MDCNWNIGLTINLKMVSDKINKVRFELMQLLHRGPLGGWLELKLSLGPVWFQIIMDGVKFMAVRAGAGRSPSLASETIINRAENVASVGQKIGQSKFASLKISRMVHSRL